MAGDPASVNATYFSIYSQKEEAAQAKPFNVGVTKICFQHSITVVRMLVYSLISTLLDDWLHYEFHNVC